MAPVSRRIKAAMVLADVNSEQLARAIDKHGLGQRTIRKFIDEKDPREPRSWELAEIARACGVPAAFFTADFFEAFTSPDLPQENRARLDRLEQTVDAILQVLEATPAPTADTDGGPTLLDLLPEDFPLETRETRRAQ